MLDFVVLASGFIFSICLFLGKGVFLLAGYSTMNSKDKKEYSEKKLGRVVSSGLFVFMIIVSLVGNFETVEMIRQLCYGAMAVDLLVVIILANTVCKA